MDSEVIKTGEVYKKGLHERKVLKIKTFLPENKPYEILYVDDKGRSQSCLYPTWKRWVKDATKVK